MASSPAIAPIVPNPRTPKTLGLLNIIFGALLVVMGLYMLTQVMVLPLLPSIMQGAQQQMEQAMHQRMPAQQDGAEADEEVATGEGEAEPADGGTQAGGPADEESPAVEGQQPGPPQVQVTPFVPDLSKIYSPFADPWVFGCGLADAVSGIVLNILMIFSGVGLLRLRSSGRKLALWVAGLKIGRLVAVYTFAIFVAVPIVAGGIGQAVDEMIAKAPGGGTPPPPGMFKMVYAVTFSGMAVAVALFGMIYPAVCLWLLRRPAIKAACEPPRAATAP